MLPDWIAVAAMSLPLAVVRILPVRYLFTSSVQKHVLGPAASSTHFCHPAVTLHFVVSFYSEELKHMTNAAERKIGRVVEQLNEEERRLILRFAEWLRDQEDQFTDKELAILRRGERQVRKGDIVWWRDVKRSEV